MWIAPQPMASSIIRVELKMAGPIWRGNYFERTKMSNLHNLCFLFLCAPTGCYMNIWILDDRFDITISFAKIFHCWEGVWTNFLLRIRMPAYEKKLKGARMGKGKLSRAKWYFRCLSVNTGLLNPNSFRDNTQSHSSGPWSYPGCRRWHQCFVESIAYILLCKVGGLWTLQLKLLLDWSSKD